MTTYLIIATIVVAVWFVWSAPRKSKAAIHERRVIWRDTDARARQRIAERWEPIDSHDGPWVVKQE